MKLQPGTSKLLAALDEWIVTLGQSKPKTLDETIDVDNKLALAKSFANYIASTTSLEQLEHLRKLQDACNDAEGG